MSIGPTYGLGIDFEEGMAVQWCIDEWIGKVEGAGLESLIHLYT